MATIFRLQNPNILTDPGFLGLLTRWSQSFGMPAPHHMVGDLGRIMTSDKAALFAGMERIDKWLAMGIVFLPEGPLNTTPQLAYFYNEGSPELRRILAQTMVDFVKQKGYTRFMALNHTGHSDKAWSKVMQVQGWTPAKVGSIMEFEANG